MHLLLVEDNARLGGFVAKTLRKGGFTVQVVNLAKDAETALLVNRYDVIVLDLALPDGDGMAILKNVRGRDDRTPVLIMTARDGLPDRVNGLNSGPTTMSSSPSRWPS